MIQLTLKMLRCGEKIWINDTDYMDWKMLRCGEKIRILCSSVQNISRVSAANGIRCCHGTINSLFLSLRVMYCFTLD